MNTALLILPNFVLILVGLALARGFDYGRGFWEGLEKLVYFVLFPALLLRSLAVSVLDLASVGKVVACAWAIMLLGMALAWLARPLFRVEAKVAASCFQCGFRFNTYIVLAVADRLGGAPALALASLLVGVLVPTVNVAAVSMLAHGRGVSVVAELVRNPLVLATAAGLAWNVAGLPVPPLPARLLELLASAALPLGLLAVGAGLTFERHALPLPALAWFHAVKLVAMPAIAFLAARALALSPLEMQVAMTQAAVPTATSAYILAARMNGRGAPVALIVSSGTLLAALTLPLWLGLVAR